MLVARNLEFIHSNKYEQTQNTRHAYVTIYNQLAFNIERLISMLSHIKADFVGGSQRSNDGHFNLGCYQMSVKNYTISILHGYDISYKSCVYCDYLSGMPTLQFMNGMQTMMATLQFIGGFIKKIRCTQTLSGFRSICNTY